VVDLAELSVPGQAHQYCVSAGGGPLIVTLVWHDAPGSLFTDAAAVNDLDLSLRMSAFGGTPVYSQNLAAADRVNNVERVRFAAAPVGNVAITVAAHFLDPTAPRQRYSLVVQGDFSGVLQSDQNPASATSGVRALASSCVCCQSVLRAHRPLRRWDRQPVRSVRGRHHAQANRQHW